MPDEKKTAEKDSPAEAVEIAWEGSLSATEEVVAPDGHVSLSKADIKERDANS